MVGEGGKREAHERLVRIPNTNIHTTAHRTPVPGSHLDARRCPGLQTRLPETREPVHRIPGRPRTVTPTVPTSHPGSASGRMSHHCM